MARIIPDIENLAEIEHSSEATIYGALRDQLGDEFTVLHSYPWLRPWRGEGALLEGEADFVILHQTLGVLVLEVKGGEGIFQNQQGWFRETQKGPKKFQDPFIQARKNIHALVNFIAERSGFRVQKGDFVYGYSVAFPHSNYTGPLPPHAERAIVISYSDMGSLEVVVRRAFKAWTELERPLSREKYQLLRDSLLPRFKLFRPVGVDIDRVSARLIELTETQAAVFEGLYGQRRVLVKGVAGSGKTLLALQRAIAFAREGVKTLFLCYNKELANWLQRQAEEDESYVEVGELLTVRNFHSLSRELALAAQIEFTPYDGRKIDQEFWESEVPEILEQAVLALGSNYDALVVDEAQDFSLSWWYALTQYLITSAAPLYAFMDPNQSLRGVVETPPLEFETNFELKINCRNTRKIAATSAALLELTSMVPRLAPDGVDVRFLRPNSPNQQKGLVLAEVKRLLEQEGVRPEQLALMGPKSLSNSSLKELIEIEGYPVTNSADEWRGGNRVLVTTARSFKGLEADVVLLFDLQSFGELFRVQDLYVACTRARVHLIVVASEGACLNALSAATQKS